MFEELRRLQPYVQWLTTGRSPRKFKLLQAVLHQMLMLPEDGKSYYVGAARVLGIYDGYEHLAMVYDGEAMQAFAAVKQVGRTFRAKWL